MSIEYDQSTAQTTSIPFSSGIEEGGLVNKKSEGGAFTNESVGAYAPASSSANSAKASEVAAQQALEEAEESAELAAAALEDAIAAKDFVASIIPTGGSEDGMLVKKSSSDYDLEWTTTINSANVDGGYF